MTITVIGAGTYVTSATTAEPTIHASTAEGDLLVAFTNKRAAADKLVPPGGWSTLYQHPQTAVDGNASEMTYYAKIAGASEATPTFTNTGTSWGSVQILTLRGNFGSNIAEVVSASNSLGADTATTIDHPALTVPDANTIILAGGKYRDTATGATANTLSGFTAIGQALSGTTASLLTVWDYQIQTAATNITAGSWTVSGATTSPSTNASIIVSIVEPAATVSLKPDMSPLYYNSQLLDNKTGIEYRISSGHAGIDSDTIVSGVNGTTNGSGVFQLPSPITTGAATDPVTVSLYWEEGTEPIVDRSIIVKTTLVAV